MAKVAPEEIIRSWSNAYEQANGKPAPRMVYENGWYVLFNPLRQPFRRAAVESMAATLRSRPPVIPHPNT